MTVLMPDRRECALLIPDPDVIDAVNYNGVYKAVQSAHVQSERRTRNINLLQKEVRYLYEMEDSWIEMPEYISFKDNYTVAGKELRVRQTRRLIKGVPARVVVFTRGRDDRDLGQVVDTALDDTMRKVVEERIGVKVTKSSILCASDGAADRCAIQLLTDMAFRQARDVRPYKQMKEGCWFIAPNFSDPPRS